MTTKRHVPILGMALLLAVSLIAGEATAFVNDPPGIAVEVGVLEMWTESPEATPIQVSPGRTADGIPFYLLAPTLDPIDNVPISIRLVNTSGRALYLPEGFKTRRFHIDLVFTDPDGQPVTANELFTTPATDPPPPPVLPLNGELVPAQKVELFSVDETINYRLRNAQGPFTLNKPGFYTVRAVINARTYLQADYLVGSSLTSLLANSNWSGTLVSDVASFYLAADRDGDRYYAPVAYDLGLDCDDNNPAVNPDSSDSCTACSPNPPTSCVTTQKGTTVVRAEKHTVGLGNHPGSTKEPLPGISVRVFDKSPGSCAFKAGISWQSYPQIYSTCPRATGGEGATDDSGKVTFDLLPGEYLAIGYYDPNRAVPGDEIYPGVKVGTVVAGTTTNKYFQVIAKADGKNIPGKYTILTGSELMIIEPEYVEWTGVQELYPFIFQASGDWSVTTSIAPPEGFVADQPALTAEVVNALQSVQFLVTDIGSEWTNTKVQHVVRHKGKERVIKGQVGVINKKEKKGKKQK